MAAAMARPWPVLPEVGSMMVPPGFSRPSRSAASIMRMPMRSLTLPPGLSISSLARIVGLTPRVTLCSRTRGVLPMASRNDSMTCIPHGSSFATGPYSPRWQTAGTGGREVSEIMDEETERARARWDRHASAYDRQIRFFERALFGGGREWVCSRARGDVLEVAIGTGRNLPFYAPDVRLTGVEFSPKMLAVAAARSRELGREVDLRLGDAQALEFPDESFDTVVFTLALCSIPDDRRAVGEAARVLRPGGTLVLL